MFAQRVLLLSLFIAALSTPAFAEAEITLYKGEPIESQGIRLGGWGSGWASVSQREFYSGTNSIELHTDGYYAGGRMDFTTPVNLSDAFSTSDTYLVFTIRFPGMAEEGEMVGDPMYSPRGVPGVPGYGPTGGGYSPYGGPGGYSGGTSDVAGPAMGFFRVMLTVNGQQLVTEDQPIDLRRTESGWTTLSVPLAAFKGNRAPGSQAMLSRIVLFGDRPDTFFVGQITTAIDDSEISLDLSPEEQTVGPGDLFQLSTTAAAGLANIEYVWDFDKSNGFQDEAYGEVVTHSFRDEGVYTVTLKVRDINGVKPELVQEIPITVAL